MKRPFALLVICALVAGCSGPTKLNSTAMESWVGADKAELVRVWGSPHEIYPGDEGGEVYTYVQERDVVVHGLSHDRSTGKATYTATRKFWIDSAGNITHWEWEGL